MIPYKLDFAFEKLLRTGPSMERTLLQIYTGNKISESEAKNLLRRIADHKWYVSERLSRDVGFHVAAIDYVEHFYEPRVDKRSQGKLAAKIWGGINSALRSYFEAKGKTIAL